MELIFKTKPVSLVEEDDIEGGKFESSESVSIYAFESDDEAEDFELLSHKEQLALCGLKEESTPEKSGTVHRYTIDPGDAYVVIRESVMSF